VGTGSADRPRASGRWAQRAARAGAATAARARRRLGGRVLPVVVVVLAAIGLAVPAASASPGDLTFAGCIGDHAGCTATSPTIALDHATAVAVVGNQVYATSAAGGFLIWFGAVSHFTMDPSGNLTFRGCIGDMPGCTASSPTRALEQADSLAASPDGRQLYVTSPDGGISHLTIDAAGNLTFVSCIGNLAGCTPTSPIDALRGAVGVAVTPDGRQLYATNYSKNVVSHLTIDPAGNLTFAGCIGNLAGCTSTYPATALDGAGGLAVTPDGAHLYVTSNAAPGSSVGNVVSHFRIDPAGNLGFAGCIGDLAGCTSTYPATALDGADAVAVTPDGGQLYATSGSGNVVSHFQIGPAGNLSFAGCIGDLAGCTTTSPPGALDGAYGLAVTADGAHLYTTSFYGNVVSRFKIGLFGDLSLVRRQPARPPVKPHHVTVPRRARSVPRHGRVRGTCLR
jgi:DNA-binding beta-propeller fold protein YncE